MSGSNDQPQSYDYSQPTFNPDQTYEYDESGQGYDNYGLSMTGGTQQYGGASGASLESYGASQQQQTAQPSSDTSSRKRAKPRKAEASNSTAPATLEDDDAVPPFVDESAYNQPTFDPDRSYDESGQHYDMYSGLPMTDASMMMAGGKQQYGASGASAESYGAGTTYNNASQQQPAQPSGSSSGPKKRGRPHKDNARKAKSRKKRAEQQTNSDRLSHSSQTQVQWCPQTQEGSYASSASAVASAPLSACDMMTDDQRQFYNSKTYEERQLYGSSMGLQSHHSAGYGAGFSGTAGQMPQLGAYDDSVRMLDSQPPSIPYSPELDRDFALAQNPNRSETWWSTVMQPPQ
ncbi:hypothetical protein B9479_008135 [Cryptococcus floricola]|uniref:Uncharacterized protein n=1 Tax=Cryptococcus floricola TaxID=2591691 RepID=A0A5D3AKX0_9TREE|nr:hypothetical protein B9479_008135 [Cryptococcus floricola]